MKNVFVWFCCVGLVIALLAPTFPLLAVLLPVFLAPLTVIITLGGLVILIGLLRSLVR